MDCPTCGGPLGILGILGNMVHILCRNCGGHFHEENVDLSELVSDMGFFESEEDPA